MRTWTTAGRPGAEQYSYWREVVCEAFTPLRPTDRDHRDAWRRESLPGHVRSRPYGSVNGAEVVSCDQSIHHGPREVARVEDPVVFVNLMVSGRCVVEQDDRRALSGPGTFTVVDATRPFRLDYRDDWRTISFRVPHADLEGGATPPPTAVTQSASQGLAGVLADAMRTAWRNAPALTSDEADAAGTAVVALLGALRAPQDDRERTPGVAAALRAGIEDHVRAHLRDGDLRPGSVAARFGISVRKLHQLFEGTGATYGQTVMRIRVESCAADLVANREHVSLTALASTWGFADLSHLNKVFRAHFGCRASEYLA